MSYMWMQHTTLYHDASIARIELAEAMRDMIVVYLTERGRMSFDAAIRAARGEVTCRGVDAPCKTYAAMDRGVIETPRGSAGRCFGAGRLRAGAWAETGAWHG